jgi:hypothetical protein
MRASRSRATWRWLPLITTLPAPILLGSDMTSGANDVVLDAVLAVQLIVGWAGETSQPSRLGWWRTDVTDSAAGGDLLARLLPRTHAWAALEAAREAARRTDERARVRMGDPDKLRTLLFLGFAVDEALADRFAFLKREGRSPVEALPIGFVQAKFSKDTFVSAFQREDVSFAIVPGGRQLVSAARTPYSRWARERRRSRAWQTRASGRAV